MVNTDGKRGLGIIALSLVVCLQAFAASESTPVSYSGDTGKPSDLPLPGSLPLQDYEKVFYTWLMERQYQSLGWLGDKSVRDTGPFINTQYYGTHPAARIYYSPEVIQWLVGGRQGDLPDGSIIIKEMFHPPAVMYQDMAENPAYSDPAKYAGFVNSMVFAWTAIVKDSSASADGWFWANPMAPGEGESIEAAVERQLDTLVGAPASEFGAPCLRCHASAESEFTFSDLQNVEGFSPEKDTLRFLVDTSWRSKEHFAKYPVSTLKDDPWVQSHMMLPAMLRPYDGKQATNAGLNATHQGVAEVAEPAHVANDHSLPSPDPEFLSTFTSIKPVPPGDVLKFPSQWTDHVVPGAQKTQEYMTSDNCIGCHGGLGGEPYGVTMFIKTGEAYGDGINLSEYGEWRWSPMGVAGRDPIFHSQLESEMAYLVRDSKMNPTPLVGSLEDNQQAVTNTCLSCHGAMGQRQLAIDAASDPSLDPNYSVDYFYLTPRLSESEPPQKNGQYVKYGQLGREGISCAICHHIDAPSEEDVTGWTPPPGWLDNERDRELAYMLFHNNTGRFVRGPADKFFGPFEDVATVPMHSTLGVTPEFNHYTSDSQLCGTCHTINLPNIGATEEEYPVLNASETNPAFQGYQHSIEQATFLEWQNSAFARNPGKEGSQFASCQDCHMPGGYESLDGSIDIDQLTTQIATIQDVNYPQAENRLPNDDIDIPLRDNYTRHEHVGLNVFLLEMFDQFPDILGVSKTDYMTSATNGVDIAIENMVRQAQQNTAEISVDDVALSGNNLKATVNIRNLTGHRFPSGVAFRRAFVEFLVLDGNEVVWGSGRTNGVGVILGGDGKPLPTEFLPNSTTYQPHHQVITSEDQVQIYEELNQNADKEFTTSFIHRVYDIKDNRLLPDGWRTATFFKPDGEVLYEFMEATDPRATGDDPDYMDQGPGFEGGDSLVYDVTLPEGIDSASLTVRASLYSQAIPPYWLHQRFNAAPEGEATKRLYYLTSRLNLEGTAMDNWKLELVSADATVAN